jgi:hypothetical protein
MTHQLSSYSNVLTVRLDGRVNAQEVYQDILNTLAKQPVPITVILDMTLATQFDQQLKSLFYRVFQHHRVARVGVCGINGQVQHDVDDLLVVLRRVRTVTVSETEADLRVEMGLAAPLPQQRKLSGMLAYLKKD